MSLRLPTRSPMLGELLSGSNLMRTKDEGLIDPGVELEVGFTDS